MAVVHLVNGPLAVFSNSTSAVFFASAGWRSGHGFAAAISTGELRALLSNLQAQPAIQFSNFEDGTNAVTLAIGSIMTANGYSPPDSGGATDISANSAKYRLCRPGYLVSLQSGSARGDAWVFGTLDLVTA